ncbi:MAG: fasciclin domain-containing protein [Bacteroidota bacterium]|nr:fasciclin domain-containing protein [Bacteroidota bacterium]
MKTTFIWVFFFALCLVGCKKWDEHNQLGSQDLTKTLLEEISQRPNLSKFYEYLKKTGLDKELSSSKTYTVWAPVNSALQSLDPAIVADSSKLRQFVGNHISYQTYFTRNAQTPVRVPMLNGKRVTFFNTKFDDANITEANKFVGNGVLHVIDNFAPVYSNAWELINNTRTSFQQSAYILSLTRKVFDPANGIIDSINSLTGQPIYRFGTDSVLRNSFNTDVYDLQNEEKQYTYFILDDAAFNAEVAKLNPYFKTSTTDSTKNLASFAVSKDLIVEGVYTLAQLPAFLTSKSGVIIPIDKSKIVETRKMSNGIAYVISGINFNVKDKIPTVVVQGENYRGFFDANGVPVIPRQNNVSAIFIRSRFNPLTNQPFIDMFAYNHGISALSAQYRVQNLPSLNYKVYWVAPNDTLYVNGAIVPVVFNQRLAMGALGTNFLPNATGQPVAINNYNEVYIGNWNQASYGTLNMFLTAAASTSSTANRLNLDYIKLVPDL